MTLRYEPMLCRSFDAPFDDTAWQFSLKLDGIRALAYIERGELMLINRAGNDVTARFPDLRAYEGYSFKRGRYVFDGEIVCERAPGVFDFQAIQTRCNRKLNIAAMAEQHPAYFYAFDILEANGEPLIQRPLRERMESLSTVYRVGGPRFNECPRIDGEGHFFWDAWPNAEGIVAKHLDSVYEPGVRSMAWRKIKRKQHMVVMVTDYTAGLGRRVGTLGALIVCDPATGIELARVGTGLSDDDLYQIKQRLDNGEDTYAEVEYLEKTNGGYLRLPVFIRLVKWPDVEG